MMTHIPSISTKSQNKFSFCLENNKAWIKVKNGFKVISNDSILIRTASYTFLNTVLLVSKIFKQIPKQVGKTALLVYSYLGLLSLPYQIKDLRKTMTDFFYSGKLHQIGPLLICCIKVCNKVAGILLTGSLFVAAMLGLIGLTSTVLAIYKVAIPIGVVSFFVGIGLDVFDAIANQRTKKQLKALSQNNNAITPKELKITRCFVKLMQGKTKNTENYKLAARMIRRLDVFRTDIYKKSIVDHLKEHSKYDEAALTALFKELHASLTHETKRNAFNFVLLLAGYISRGIYRAYPDTLIQAASTWGVQILFLLQTISDKIYNSRLNKRLTATTA